MLKRNYALEMERTLRALDASGARPTLVLHACCAPCSSAVLERLNAHFRLEVLYDNPNIGPRAEFERRAAEEARLMRALPLAADAHLTVAPYVPEDFLSAVRGHEADPEGGARCAICFELRLRHAAMHARAIGADYFTTTLSISPLKDAQLLNGIGLRLAAEYGVAYLTSDFKKRDGYRRSCELSERYGLYRQDYCGCAFSRAERARIKAARAAEAADAGAAPEPASMPRAPEKAP